MSSSPLAKPKLLFLAYLLPWPLEGGGQIKSYQTLRLLAERFDITLLALIRTRAEAEHAAPLAPLCAGGLTTFLLPRGRGRDLVAMLRAAATGQPLRIARDAAPAMSAAVRAALETEPFAAVHADHLTMLSFVPPPGDPLLSGVKIVLDQHNVEHRIVQHLARGDGGVSPLLRAVARWEGPRLRRFEQAACRRADLVLAVSEKDAGVFAELLRGTGAAATVRVTPIGVDSGYFAPRNSPSRVSPMILTVGTMYWPPNVAGVRWFCAEILPLIRRQAPDACFQIVGTKPTPAVRALARTGQGCIRVTGTVPDVRPFMADCGVFVVPLRAGSGMRVKILNALAMGLPVVSTTLGAEGIAVTDRENILLADTPEAFAAAVIRVLADRALAARLGAGGRALAVRSYDWKVAGQCLLRAYEELIPRV
ncbi:MAG: glycosyltransferase [Cytophagales bacterium]|nr:glycosyltransferase [Armatimonadota bacterium]